MFSHREAIEPVGKRQLTGGAAGITRCNRRTPLTIALPQRAWQGRVDREKKRT